MEITEVRIKLTSGKNEKLRAFCSITIDNDFVIRDLKVIEGAKGAFVAMPSRKLMARCSFCSGKNHYRAPYCNECGGRLSPERLSLDGRRKLHADVAHPINSGCRESIQQRVLAYYQEETEKAKDPSYRPVDIDDFDDVFFDDESEVAVGPERPRWASDRRDAPTPPESGRHTSLGVTLDGDTLDGIERESDQASRERALEESEWEETRIDGESGEERVSDPAISSAQASPGTPADEHDDRGATLPRPATTPPRPAPTPPRPAPDGSRSSSENEGARSQDGSRRGGRSRQRSGGPRRRGRDPFREGARPGDRDRVRESDERERSSEGVRGEKSPMAVEFDDLRSGHRLSGRQSSGRQSSGRQSSGRVSSDRPSRQGSSRQDRGRQDSGERSGERSGQSPSGPREARRSDEATGEPRIRERGGQRRADAARLRDPEKLAADRMPEKLPIEETDVEPEDNFGSGLFS